MESKVFTTSKELKKEYNAMRNVILEKLDTQGQKVRLKNAIYLYVDFGTGFVRKTGVLSDMINDVKFYEICGKEYNYKLVTGEWFKEYEEAI